MNAHRRPCPSRCLHRSDLPWLSLSALLLFSSLCPAQDPPENLRVFDRQNLVAWCIVPFDAKHRGPEERAAMLSALGLHRCAYDWREEHVPTFEAEIQAYAKHDIEFFAFWGAHESAFQLFQKYDLKPQIWQTAPSPDAPSQEARIQAATQALTPLVQRTHALGLPLGLYNHGGWGGEPANLVALCRFLRQQGDADHVGIVYNFHHGHQDILHIDEALALMKPYLLCLNLNGMNDDADPKILPIGQGKHDDTMLTAVLRSGYQGPIGILDHLQEIDSAVALQANLDGLDRWLAQQKKKD